MADFALRGIPDDLYDTLRRAADRNHRSVNGEILARLEASVRPSTVDADVLLARIEERRGRLDDGSATGEFPCLDDSLLRELKQAGRS